MQPRFFNLLISGLAAIAIYVILLVVSLVLDGTSAQRVFVLLGGSFPSGLIQTFTYALFMFGLFEFRQLNAQLLEEESAFSLGILPEKEHLVIDAGEVMDIKLKAAETAKEKPLLVLDLIKKVCTKFRANQAISELLSVLSSQIKTNQARHESEMTLLEYVIYAIPSIGFVGTIFGIASSLEKSKLLVEAQNKPAVVVAGKMIDSNLKAINEAMEQVTTQLYVAFDTTLVALALGLVLTLLYQLLNRKVYRFHAHSEEYVLENLINRIYEPVKGRN